MRLEILFTCPEVKGFVCLLSKKASNKIKQLIKKTYWKRTKSVKGDEEVTSDPELNMIINSEEVFNLEYNREQKRFLIEIFL